MIRYITIPFTSFAIMMLYAGLMGKQRLVEYAIGQEKVLVEEYGIIVVIVTIITVIRHVIIANKEQ
jgi:hypothetical protein